MLSTGRLDRAALRAMVADLLALDPDELGYDDDLLRLGMDSIQVIRLAGECRRNGAEVTYAELIERRTVRQWWELVTARLAPETGEPYLPDVAEGEPFDLAPMQHAYWVGRGDEQRLGGVGAQFYCEFDGTGVDPDRLRVAVRALVARHGMLRARFRSDGKQWIAPEGRCAVPVYDLRDLSEATAQAHTERIRAELSQRRMVVEDGQVFDVSLSLLPGGRSRVHLAVEMLVCDAQSFQILLADLAALYADPRAPLQPLRLTYPRYRAAVTGRPASAADRDRDWWRDRLATLPGPPDLPTAGDPTRPVGRTHRQRCLTVSEADRKRLAAGAREHGVLLSMALAAAFSEVVGAWSANHRFLLTMPYYDRQDLHPDVDGLVGDFTDVVLVPAETGVAAPFAERVRHFQETFHEHLAHGAYSGVDVLRDLRRVRPGADPAVPVVFTSAANLGELFGPRLRRELGAPGYTMSTTPQVGLDCQVTERGGDLFLNWDAVEELFPAGVLDAMFGAYRRLLDRLVDGDWAEPIGSLLPAEQATVRARVNATPAVAPPGLLHDDVFALARADAERVAVLAGDETWSYGALADRALRVAGWLGERGVVPGDTVGVSLPRGPAQLAAVLGVLAAGGAYVPIGPEQPPARQDRIRRSAGIRLTVTAADVEAAAARPARPEPVPVRPDGLAYVIYTSGSTGEPKGVEITHAAAWNTIAAINRRYDVGPADRVLALSALDFDLSVYDIFGLLSVGGTVVTIDDQDRKEATAWVELARRHGVTIWNSVPALLDMALIVGLENAGWAHRLRLVLVSGDWVGVDLPDRLHAQAPTCRFVALGGATEAAIWSNSHEVDHVPPDWRSIPYGRPLPGQRFRVVDHSGRDCPDWTPGELWIGGAGVALGYRADPARTAERFVTVGGERWYRTGDQGRYRPHGTLEFLGRRDSQVKIGGYRVELGDVEAALGSHPGVAAAVAVVIERPARRLGAAVTPADPADPPTPAQLHAHCSALLPDYLTPAADALRVLPELPLTANGKVDRAALAESLAPAGDLPEQIYQPARGQLETAVAEVWARLLDHAPVGRSDNFFALGGDSLLATRMLAELRAAGVAGGRLPSLFAAPTLAGFAATLHADAPAEVPVLVPAPAERHQPFPPTDVQRAYWMGRAGSFELGAVGSHWYWEFDGAGLDLTRLEDAWNRLIERHEMLRAVFDDDGNQRILPTVDRVAIPVEQPAPDRAEEALDRLRADLSHRVADPGRWPLNEIRAVRYGDRVRLAFSFDYIVLDALSIVVVLAELGRLYADPAETPPPVGMSFRDYVLYGGPDDAELERAWRYWQEQLERLPPAPALPLAIDPTAVGSPRFGRREWTMPADRWDGLVQAARRWEVTPAAALATAFGTVLGGFARRPDFTLNLTLFDRRPVHPEVNATLGDFTSLLLAPYRPLGGEAFAIAARRYQETIWGGMEHRAVSAVRVMREYARRTGPAAAAMPVVFTSALGLPTELVDIDLPFGTPVWGISQTPQVWLDCQVSVRGGTLVVTWDAVEELFPPDLLDVMFAAYRAALETLAGGDWAAPLTVAGLGTAVEDTEWPERPVEPPSHEPPGSATEIALAGLWTQLLGVERIGRTDNFFALGGDSVLATALVVAIRRELARPMTLRALLDSPTLAGLADALDGEAPLDEGII